MRQDVFEASIYLNPANRARSNSSDLVGRWASLRSTNRTVNCIMADSNVSCQARDPDKECTVCQSCRDIQLPGRVKDHGTELDLVAGGELAHAVEIGRNDVRDMRVTAHGPASHAQDDELSPGDLDGARGHGCGQPIGLRHELKGRPLQAQTHAVAP